MPRRYWGDPADEPDTEYDPSSPTGERVHRSGEPGTYDGRSADEEADRSADQMERWMQGD